MGWLQWCHPLQRRCFKRFDRGNPHHLLGLVDPEQRIMDHMALVTAVSQLNMLLFQVFRHPYHLDPFPWPGLDYFIVAAEAEINYFITPFYRQRAHLFAVSDMIAVWTMTDLAGYGFVDAFLMNGAYRFMAGETGIIGAEKYRHGSLIVDVRSPVMPIFSHTLGNKHFPSHQPDNDDNNQSNDQPDQVGVVSCFRLLMHVASPSVESFLLSEWCRREAFLSITSPFPQVWYHTGIR